MAACSDLTDIKNTGIVQPESENNAVGAAAFYAGATQKFVAATQNSIMFTGLFTDEWIDGTNGGVFGYLDARRAQTSVVQTGQELTDYSNALIAVRFATEALLKYAPKPGSRVAQMYSYSGYLELFLAEQFCNGIPFGNIDFNGTVTHGAGITTAETYARAIAHFDSAIAVSDSARSDQPCPGREGACAGWSRQIRGSSGRGRRGAYQLRVQPRYQCNRRREPEHPVHVRHSEQAHWRLAGSQRDQRDQLGRRRRSARSRAGEWKGPRRDSGCVYLPSVQRARGSRAYRDWYCARLIQAEAALQANNNDAATTGTGWLGILNTLRTTGITPAMTPLADPGSFAARVDLLFRERAFWLYLTANRMPDMRRLVRQYGRAENTVFPTGTYKDNLPYGTEVNFVAPTLEGPNPAYTGCIDRKA
jgi:hypothetical protein